MDFQITKFINHLWSSSRVDDVSIFVSQVLFLVILWSVVTMLIIIKDKKNRNIVLVTLFTAIILHSIITEYFLKHIIAVNLEVFRSRPWIAYPNDIIAIGKHFTDTSFPSSHVSSTVAILSILTFFYRKYWIWAILFIFIMAFSRIHNGMHYFSDVIVGTMLGLLYGFIAIKITKSNTVL